MDRRDASNVLGAPLHIAHWSVQVEGRRRHSFDREHTFANYVALKLGLCRSADCFIIELGVLALLRNALICCHYSCILLVYSLGCDLSLSPVIVASHFRLSFSFVFAKSKSFFLALSNCSRLPRREALSSSRILACNIRTFCPWKACGMTRVVFGVGDWTMFARR